MTEATGLPVLHFSTAGLGAAEAAAAWCELMAPMYQVARASHAETAPGGQLTAFLLGDILANRTIFHPQHVTRTKRLIERTPDHVVLQLWRSGGTRGEIAGRDASFGPGQVALADRRREVDSRITRSDTLGFVIPRTLLAGIDVDELAPSFDPRRNRLAAAHIEALYRSLPQTRSEAVPAVVADLLAFLRRLADPSRAADVLEGAELDVGLRELAEQLIQTQLGSPLLSPDLIAGKVGVSRATLYRLFAPLGGIMRVVGERRLLAARAALGDPLETRSLTQLSGDCGFRSLPAFSRAFRSRFGITPRDLRSSRVQRWQEERQARADPILRWWSQLGR